MTSLQVMSAYGNGVATCSYTLQGWCVTGSPFTTPRMRGAEGQGPTGPLREWMCYVKRKPLLIIVVIK